VLAAASSRLTEREDVEALVRAVQRTREIIATEPIASTVERELLPGEGADIATSSETRQTNRPSGVQKGATY
jgi:choline dehydrogenase